MLLFRPAAVKKIKKRNKYKSISSRRKNCLAKRAYSNGVLVKPDKFALMPIAVVFDNFPKTHPPAGLLSASVVYELPVEGGITRFLAIFDFDALPEKIGPVRSARPYLAELADEYGAIFLHTGGSPEVISKLKKNYYNRLYNIDEISADGKYFWRDDKYSPPFNLHTSAERMIGLITDKKIVNRANFDGWKYKSEATQIEGGGAVSDIAIKYKTPVVWRYDTQNELYLRSQGNGISKDEPFLDTDGQQISAKNVIIQITDVKVIDQIGRCEIRMSGEGRAIIFQNGRKIEGTWRKNNNRTKFYNSSGQEIEFLRGNDWVEVVTEKLIDL